MPPPPLRQGGGGGQKIQCPPKGVKYPDLNLQSRLFRFAFNTRISAILVI